MKALSTFVFLISITAFIEYAFANRILEKEIEHSQLVFRYGSNDGQIEMPCKHYIHNPSSGDWRVICEDKDGRWQKEFSVHFFIREVSKNSKPEQMIELLFALTDRNFSKPYFSSQYLRLSQEKISPTSNVFLSLGVENDYASLDLQYFPQKKSR